MIVAPSGGSVALLSAEKVEFIVVTRRRGVPTLAGQLLALQLAIIVVVLVAVAGVSLAQAGATFDRVEGRRVAGLAEQLAVSPLVRGQPGPPRDPDRPGHPRPEPGRPRPGSPR